MNDEFKLRVGFAEIVGDFIADGWFPFAPPFAGFASVHMVFFSEGKNPPPWLEGGGFPSWE